MSVSESVVDSRVVILDEDFTAFRDEEGTWSTKSPGFTLGDLADEFRRVKDSDTATKLRREAATALSP